MRGGPYRYVLRVSAIIVGRPGHPIDLKPADVLLLIPDVDEVVRKGDSEGPAEIYGLPKSITPRELPLPPAMPTLLHFIPPSTASPRILDMVR